MINLLRIFLLLLLATYTYQVCDGNCLVCPEDVCEECKTDYYVVLTDGSCVLSTDCPEGTVPMIIDTRVCSCDDSCYTCSAQPTNCTDCTITYLYKNQCIDSCTTGTFDPIGDAVQSEHGWMCEDCDVSCLTCEVEATNCTSCAEDGKYALQNVCVDAAGCEANNKYGDDTLKICQSCSAPCQSCSGSGTVCTSCVTGYFLEGNACVESCSDSNYFEDSRIPLNPLCSHCDANCAECHASPVQCTICPEADGTFLQASNEKCVSECEPGTFQNSSTVGNKLCSNCKAPCSECMEEESKCTKCTEGSLLFLLGNVCTDTCEVGQFKNSSTSDAKICSDCINNCETCETAIQCTKCSTTQEYYLTPTDTCELQCPDTTFKNSSTADNRLCSPCAAPCKNCENSETTCKSCEDSYFYYDPSNICFDICPAGTFESDIYCYDCDSDISYCSECFGANNNCTKCTEASGTYLFENHCVESENCPIGTYPDSNLTTHKQCLSCPENCSQCNSFTECVSCTSESNYLLYNKACVEECPSGYYPDTADADNKICIKCNSPCKECAATSDNCTECTVESGLYLKNNLCEEKCGVGYYINSTFTYKLCTICTAPCAECTSADYCTRCDGSLEQYLYQNECTDTCPKKTYKDFEDTTNKVCSDCKLTCADCTTLNTCIECTDESGLFLWNNKCIAECPKGTFFDDSFTYFACTECTAPCIECTSASSCTQCSSESNTYLSYHQCVSECPTKTYKNIADAENPTCSPCNTECQECETSSYKCLKCIAALYLHENTCYIAQECPANTFANATTEDDRLCSFCNSPCSECSTGPDQCTKCVEATNTFLIASQFKCVGDDGCPEGMYADKVDNANKICKECLAPCETCYAQEDYCLTCTSESNTYLSDNTCLPECPEGTYQNIADAANKICSPCTSPCSACTSEGCTKCLESNKTYLNGFECISKEECPEGTFADAAVISDRKCSMCVEPCATCYAVGTFCLLCTVESNTYLYDGKCFDSVSCPVGTFADNTDPTKKICSTCNTLCEECTATECTKCKQELGAVLINGECLVECPKGQYLTKIDEVHTCQACTSPCEECYDATDACTKCTDSSGLYLLGWQCVLDTDCPADYYPFASETEGRICFPIDPVNTIYSYKTIAVAAMIAFVIFIYTTMIKI